VVRPQRFSVYTGFVASLAIVIVLLLYLN
jgi:hypothetical protein